MGEDRLSVMEGFFEEITLKKRDSKNEWKLVVGGQIQKWELQTNWHEYSVAGTILQHLRNWMETNTAGA